MEKIYRDEDVNWDVLKGKTIAVLGYGIQGKAQAANTRESGFKVIIGSGSSLAEAKQDGFDAYPIGEAVAKADIILIELADPVQPPIYKKDIAPNLRAGQTLCFCHGFSVLYGQIVPPRDVNCVLFVPNAPGKFVREKFLKGEGVYGCVGVDHDATGDAREIAFAISKAVGSTRAGVVELSFQHETEGDNFEEQILYGGAIALMRACFNTMVDNGYPASFAYAKAIRSLRSVIDVMDEVGIEEYISRRSSRTCEYAVRTRGPRVINEAEIRKIFAETERGEFAKEWMNEFALGMPTLHRMRRTAANSTMEKTGIIWREKFGA
ncbi:MAG TPA: ketol-acid reductoisomerase [Tepidisphaeraceae bacterium]|jgi:ketol-acid reductoisomerase|nr:ketol-acid reductoisomerase [Tepidisphaeraceae bacterium]